MSRRRDMEAFWDEAAREDALSFVDDHGRRLDTFWARGEEALERFEQDLGFEISGGVIVEIGCGVGRMTRLLAARAREVTALDVSAEMLAQARLHNPTLENVRWLHGDGRSLAGVADGAADGVFSHVVFQHIPDPRITLGYVREMGRVLRPGGWAAFQVSNDPRIHRRRLRVPRMTRHPAGRGSAVDLGELRDAASAAGLEVERVAAQGTQYCLVRLQAPTSR